MEPRITRWTRRFLVNIHVRLQLSDMGTGSRTERNLGVVVLLKIEDVQISENSRTE